MNSSKDIEALQTRLRDAQGPEYWRSLDQLADTPEFRRFVEAEFPSAYVPEEGPSRREFMKLMGASFALAGLAGCVRQPEEKIVPYVKPPEEMLPGKPLQYATALSHDGYANGVLVTTYEARPTKVEGNKEHPQSLGATTVYAQADVLQLYDPDRSKAVLDRGQPSTWNELLTQLLPELQKLGAVSGMGLALVTPTVTSPTLGAMMEQFQQKFPRARWHQWQPLSRHNAYEGARQAFGEALETSYDLSKADVVLSLDADFMHTMPGGLRNARAFADRRRNGQAGNRLYVVESTPTVSSFQADHRLRLQPGRMGAFLAEIARQLGIDVKVGGASGADAAFVAAVASDLKVAAGRSAVIVGDSQPADVHALANAINARLSNVGRTVLFTQPVAAQPQNEVYSLKALVKNIEAGETSLVVVIGNPVYDAPADLGLAQAFAKLKTLVHVGTYVDETGRNAHWHVPLSHAFEAWGDARAVDGTATITQPLIAPLYASKSAIEIVAMLLGQMGKSGLELVQDYWKGQYKGLDFDKSWRRSLHDGVVAGSAFAKKTPGLAAGFVPTVQAGTPELEICFIHDASMYDGRYSNNAWLMELPKPDSKVTWDNILQMSPRTAYRLGLENEDVAEVSVGDKVVRGPVWVVPGQAEETVAISFGYGRQGIGRIADGVGYSAYAVRPSTDLYFAKGKISKEQGKHKIACTQDHSSLEGRALFRSASKAEFEKDKAFAKRPDEHIKRATLYSSGVPKLDAPHQWGMTIDLSACIGCNACTIACQAENNISLVGKEEVLNGREMHWIRIDRYYTGEQDDPEMVAQPVACVHCENAPCELVCPVNATVHGADGINQMVYNRCIGTRYCSNNCPYKVRRFNFLLYADFETESYKAQRNPNVSVRSRGVMEKCTYCIQRIAPARIAARKENRKIRDGEVVTACEAVCPTEAIVFGDISDPKSRVSQSKKSAVDYTLLDELNTNPRTSYLAQVKNPNAVLAKKTAQPKPHGGAQHGGLQPQVTEAKKS